MIGGLTSLAIDAGLTVGETRTAIRRLISVVQLHRMRLDIRLGLMGWEDQSPSGFCRRSYSSYVMGCRCMGCREEKRGYDRRYQEAKIRRG